MSTLQNISINEDGDEPSEASIIQWGLDPDNPMLQNLRTLTTDSSEQQRASQEIVPSDASQTGSVLPMTITGVRDTRAEFRLSENAQMYNSGNSIQINVNYNASPAAFPDTTNPAITDQSQSASPLSESEGIPTPSSSPFFSGAGHHNLSEFHESDADEHLEFPKACGHEDSCYLESVTSKTAIRFPKGTFPYIKMYMSSELFPGFSKPLVPLWTCRRRHRLIPVGEVGLVGDVGFFNTMGGFTSLFNIFWTRAENERHGYDPPDTFEEYASYGIRKKILQQTRAAPAKQNPIFHKPCGKFRRVQDNEPSLLFFRADANVTDSSHGSIVAYHKTIENRIDTTHPAGNENAMQHYLNKNAAKWYAYYNDNDERHTLKNGQLMLVQTSLSTDSWASAVFTDGLAWEVGKYFARLIPTDPMFPHLYSWDVHECVKSHSSSELGDHDPDPSDHCIAIGVDAIHVGKPPGHKTKKIKRGISSLSQSISALSILSLSNSIASRLTIRRRQ